MEFVAADCLIDWSRHPEIRITELSEATVKLTDSGQIRLIHPDHPNLWATLTLSRAEAEALLRGVIEREANAGESQ